MWCQTKRVFSALLLFFSTSAAASLLDQYSESQSPLAGRIWNTQSEQFVELEHILDQLPAGSWLLLGETHENMDHHRVETEIIEYLATQSKLGTVGLEMAHTEQQTLLDSAMRGEIEITPENLAWQKGWPWEWYEAPVSSALKLAKRVVAGDLTREVKMQAYMDTSLEVPASAEYKEFMLNLLFESHCGQMPKSQLSNMLNVQYSRDRAMLNTIQANTDPNQVNLFLAGTVHARDDLGIPYWQPELNSTSVLMIAAQASSDPRDYYPDSYTQVPAAKYLLFTPSYSYQSGCD